jgi:hypothetical protein
MSYFSYTNKRGHKGGSQSLTYSTAVTHSTVCCCCLYLLQPLPPQACQFLTGHSQHLSPLPGSPQFAWKWILLTDAAGCMAVTQTLIDHTMQSKAMVAACSTAVLAMLSEESKQHIQAFLSKRKKTARISSTKEQVMHC